jgi:hypothetical protein
MHNALVFCLQEQAVQVCWCAKILPKNFMERDSHFARNDGCQGTFAHSWRANEKTVIESLVVLEGGIKSHSHLFDDSPVPDQMIQAGRLDMVEISGHGFVAHTAIRT